MFEIFPSSVLDNSILTSVLIGVLITWALQEWFGWNFSGIVVPGYLASIFAIQPETGAVVVVEGALTYAFVYTLSELTPAHWPTSRLFGRDRFFALLLGSVTVRLLVEGIGLGQLALFLGRPLSPALHSMGLLVMPLAANALWRTGMGPGLVRLGVPVLITWFVLVTFFFPYTNLSLTSFELTYEDLAVDFVTSPKAYMLLLAGAWLGSVTNREYGFDFGGIIVPGLLAVCWMWPSRVVSTFAEALVVWMMIGLALRTPGLRKMNLTGPRLLVFAFTMIYLLKFFLGWTVGTTWPGARLRDLFGFGYLLPTLMGLRMHKHGQPFRFMVPTLLASLVAFLGAGALGYLLALVLPAPEPVIETVDDGERVFAAYANEGPLPMARAMEQSVSGGEGFGSLWRRNGNGPALVARVGDPGLAGAVLDLAPVLDARAVLLCGLDGPGCELGGRILAREGPVWWAEAAVRSTLLVRGDDLAGVDGRALRSALPDLVVRPGTGDRTRLGLGHSVRSRPSAAMEPAALTPLTGADERPPLGLGALRALRYELAAVLARFHAGDDLAEGTLGRVAAWYGWGVLRDRETVVVSGPDVQVQVRRGGRPLIVHVPEAENPGILPLAHLVAGALDARALVFDAPPSLHAIDGEHERPSYPVLTGLLEAWPEADVLELRGLRDVYDIKASWAWSVGESEAAAPPLVEELTNLLGAKPVGFSANAIDQVLRGRSSPLRRARGEHHLVALVDTRIRHRFVAFDEVEGLPRRFAVLEGHRIEVELPETLAAGLVDLRTANAARLVAALDKQGVQLALRCTRSDQCGWFELTSCANGDCESVLIPRFRGLGSGALSAAPSAVP